MSIATMKTLRYEWLQGTARNVYSQFGEDGLIEAAIEHFGILPSWCFEVGACDGVTLSNTKHLVNQGWGAVLIEGNPKYYALLERQQSDMVRTVQCCIGARDLDNILDEQIGNEHIGLGVIDVDEQDFWVWAGMERHRPDLMLIEYLASAEPRTVPRLFDEEMLGIGTPVQAGLDVIIWLGRAKGYIALATTPCNVLFCREEMLNV